MYAACVRQRVCTYAMIPPWVFLVQTRSPADARSGDTIDALPVPVLGSSKAPTNAHDAAARARAGDMPGARLEERVGETEQRRPRATVEPPQVMTDDAPFRGDLLNADRLADEARALASLQEPVTQPPIRTTPLIALADAAAAGLAHDNIVLSAATRAQLSLSPASEWLLDNYYLIEEQLLAVREDLPARYGIELPRLTSGPYAGYPRVFEAAVELLVHTDARVDEPYLLRFVEAYQDVSPLSIGELWAVPIMLRIAVVENLRRLSRRVVLSHEAELSADEWAERVLLTVQNAPEELPGLIQELETASVDQTPPFFGRLSQRLGGMEAGGEPVNAWLQGRVSSLGIVLEEHVHAQQQEQAANQVSIANSITTIRFFDAFEWKAFFETVSVVEQALCEDPAGVYPRMDFASRDRCRHAIEQMARRCSFTETELVEAVLGFASDALARDPSDLVRGHVAYYLVSAGRYELEPTVGYRRTRREWAYRGPLRHRGLIYGTLLGGLTALLVGLATWWVALTGGPALGTTIVALLAIFPLSEVALTVTNRTLAGIYPPRSLLKLDFTHPVAESNRTLVVVPALLSSVPSTQAVVDNLEISYLANRDPNIAYALLGDLRGAPEPERPDDGEIVEAAVRAVSQLNDRYEVEHGVRPFHLFIRGRTYNESEGLWMGWERKRGALLELARALHGEDGSAFTHKMGEIGFRRDVTFVVTLDADTQLPRDAARKLVSTIAHPMNRAQWRHGELRVEGGYGLVQPRVSMTLPGSRKSRFAWMYSGATGLDPYVGAASDTYQDVFGEGSFTGKGIFELAVFLGVLEERFPEDSMLSHDLIEGSFLRTALATDVEVLDDYPASFAADLSRVHRWIRGDWQTVPWLFLSARDAQGRLTANPLTSLHRWKIIDNLRRSLVAPTSVLLATLGWLALGSPALVWPLFATLFVLFPVVFGFVDAILMRPRSVHLGSSVRAIARDTGRDLSRSLFELSVLPYRSWVAADAIARAMWRTFVSRKHLLEWETADDAARRLGSTRAGFVHRMWPSSLASVALLAVATIPIPVRALIAAPLALAWALAPLIAWRISQPIKVREPVPLTGPQHQLLRRIARKTWRYFDTFVTDEGHYLVPDNFQEDPQGEVAWRTSPTNVGLQLLAYLNAYDLGYVTIDGLVERVSSTLSSMAGLERFHGHFYNWYDIQSLEPLRPNYISTVDSGNLAGHLLVLRVGLLEASEAPLLDRQLVAGLRDAVRLALEDVVVERASLNSLPQQPLMDVLDDLERELELQEPPQTLGEWNGLLLRLSGMADRLAHAVEPVELGFSATSAERPFHQSVYAPDDTVDLDLPSTARARVVSSVRTVIDDVGSIRGVIDALTPWAGLLSEMPPALSAHPRLAALEPLTRFVPSLVGIAEGLGEVLEALELIAHESWSAEDADTQAAREWADAVAAGIRSARPQCVELLSRLRIDTDIARQMWEHTDFTVLFDEHRSLFSIGFNTAEGHLDGSYYDMLASECRLASFLAIAKGDAPQEHWFRLGRLITQTGTGRALVSWSASMFEYLMPLLVMRSWDGTLLDETYGTVVRRQIQYGKDRGVPWGVSESAFNAKDADLTYQYQAFGVPGLGLKRGLSEDVVVAPYASLLALPVDAQSVLDNLGAITRQGGEGRWGFYEAIDYTPGRIPAGETRAVVKAYFAHHQGMSFVALGNELTGEKMRHRFRADPLVVSAELLLQERVPRHVQLTSPHVEEVRFVRSLRELPPPVARSYPTADTPVPSTHFLSNGRYSVMVTNGGGGYSRFENVAITRYREDVTRDCWGTFFYIRDTESGHVFSATHQPCPTPADNYFVTFAPDKAEYRRTDGNLETRVEVAVSPEDDVEVRRLTITNHGREGRTLEVTSYLEIAFTSQASDQAHKSFSNLFVETEVLDDLNALLFTRRPRSSSEARLWGLHALACENELCEWSFETDRASFLGRLRGVADPLAVSRGGELGRGVGAVLDPSCSLRRTVKVGPGESARLVFTTGAAEDRETATQLVEKYRDARSAQRAIDLAWTATQLELRDLGITPDEAVTLERLASRLLLTDPNSRLKVKTPVENGLQMSGLWSIGISGDNPILLVRVEELEHAPLVRQAILAHQYWRHKGLVSDLVILNTRPTGYADELDDRLRLLVRTGHALQLVDKPGGIYLRRADQMHPDVLNLLLSVARATLDGDGGSIELQLSRRAARPAVPGELVPTRSAEPWPTSPFQRPALTLDNGFGGFDTATGDYVIVLEGDETTPAPWVNVMATAEFGCLVSEAGVGCTWALNSHENRITTWNNDAVSDGSGEALYIRDEETGEFWSPTPLPVRDEEPYVIRHGKGVTRFEHASHGLSQEIDWFVAVDAPVRIVRLRLTNTGARERHLSVTQFVEWVLGDSRSRAQQLVVTWFDAESTILTAHNHFNLDFPGRSAFLACDAELHSYTASRTEFVGRNGRPGDPAAMYRKGLGAQSGRFLDNCGALMTKVDIAPGESAEVSFLLGQTATLEESRDAVARLRQHGAIDKALADARAFWTDLLGSVQVQSPDAALDIMVNGNALYQALACRIWGRTGTYQSSGAFGFRDQLQDVLALLLVRPDLVREQIVEASRHQFEAGDVLHWWQPHSGRGVRTHISDDRHWLPLVVAEYVTATGDTSVLDERTAYIEGPELPPEQEDLYLQPAVSEQAATVFEHCMVALGRFGIGSHGLPLMEGGDWNDGMNRVGHEGRGESVWLGWFLAYVASRFASVCDLIGETARAQHYRAWSAGLAQAVELEGWDGGWYRRAYFDDGTPLGSHTSEECRIDAIAQSWAVISGFGNPERTRAAIDAVEEKLVRREAGLVALLTPPFDRMSHDPGYIKGYVPGVRENGGQYTHAAVWLILAYLLKGDGDEAVSLFDLVNPISHALTAEAAARYVVEPYVIAADVYAAEPHVGRGGWTWYTGSAAWFYRVALNHLYGLRIEARDGTRFLVMDPCIPKDWPAYEITYRSGATRYHIRVENPRGVNRGVARVELDGVVLAEPVVPLSEEPGAHQVIVTLLGG